MIKKIAVFLFILAAASVPAAFAIDRVAVLDFAGSDINETDSRAVSDVFRSDLVISGAFTVLERSNIEAILSEHKLQMSGFADSSSAVEIGKLLSVSYLFTGNLSRLGSKIVIVVNKINIESGQIEKSVRRTIANIESFIDESPAMVAELSGETAAPVASDLVYDAVTLTQMLENSGLFSISSVEIDKKKMQTTDQEIRRGVYDDLHKQNAVLYSGLNLISFGIAGSFLQGFNEYGLLCVGTTALFAASVFALDNSTLTLASGLLFAGSWIASLGLPFYFEINFNKNLRDKLLVY